MENANLEGVLKSDAKLYPPIGAVQEGINSDQILTHAINNPSIKSLKTKGKLPKYFYDELKRNSKKVSYDPHVRRLLANGDISAIEEKLSGERAKALIYDTPGRFYPYRKALGEGAKALLKLSPFLIGGYFADNFLHGLANPKFNLFNILNPLTIGKKIAFGGAYLIWSQIKVPLIGLAGIYTAYKTIKGFMKGRKERKTAKKLEDRMKLEEIAYDLKKQKNAYLENIASQMG